MTILIAIIGEVENGLASLQLELILWQVFTIDSQQSWSCEVEAGDAKIVSLKLGA